ncbi:MAG: LacI family DNA-binding transcriptional regulator [Rikenellaceae bacterium]
MLKGGSRVSRIKDIAALSGVSIGTVDRVLHNRGDVSPQSRERVERAMAELNYKPNLYASALAQNRVEHRVVCLMPHAAVGSYWAEIEGGIWEAAQELVNLNLLLTIHYFDQYDSHSFIDETQKVISAGGVKAIMFAPIFREESIAFASSLREMGIAFSLLDSCIDVDGMVSFFGQDAYRSGRLAYRLLQLHVADGSDVLLFHSYRGGNRWSTQSASRRKGFDDAMEVDRVKSLNVETVELPMSNEEEALARIEQIVLERPNANAIVIFNSRSYLIAEVLQKLSKRDIAVIGFDALERNVEALKSGYIAGLIGQHPKLQGYRSLKSLVDSMILKQRVERMNYMPLDILIAENIDDYRSFTFK